MALKTSVPIIRPSDGFRRKLLATAEPLDAITLKRAEFARYVIPAAREAVIAAGMARQGRKDEFRMPCSDAAQRIANELSLMGDPVARWALSKSGGKGADARFSFTDDGFFIDDGFQPVLTPSGVMAGFGEGAYGIILHKYETGCRTINIGSMMHNEVRVSWKPGAPELDTTVDAHFLLDHAMDSVHAYRYRQYDFPELHLIGQDGRAEGSWRRSISAEDMERFVRTDIMDTWFLARLTSAPKEEAVTALASAMHLHYDYLCTKRTCADDETGHVIAALNSLIHDELVRACLSAPGLEHWETFASMAYGNTHRALSLIGAHIFLSITSGSADACAELEPSLVALGSVLGRTDPVSAQSALSLLCIVPEAEIRASAREVLASSSGAQGGMPKEAMEELESIEEKGFVTAKSLPRMLAVFRLREEKGSELKPAPAGEFTETRRQGN
jgi:hypothetical protein